MNKVITNKKALKQLKKLPAHIRVNYQTWTKLVELNGIRKTRKIKGYHDEPLTGTRQDQRSIRLSKAYRAFYIEYEGFIEEAIYEIVEVTEVNKHEY